MFSLMISNIYKMT